jgi:FkbM family methyltransferase
VRHQHVLKDLLRQHGVDAQGIVHIGAHTAQEREYYAACGFQRVLWIEPNPELAAVLRNDGLAVIEAAIVEQAGDIALHRTTDNQQSSTLKPRRYDVQDTISVEGKRLDELNTNNCNVLVIDVQGAELSVLRSDSKLERWQMVIAECGRRERYHGQALRRDIERYMRRSGFRLVHEIRHGKSPVSDLVWIRR